MSDLDEAKMLLEKIAYTNKTKSGIATSTT